MSMSLLKGAAVTRSIVPQSALWNTVRYASQTSKAVTPADAVNVVNVDVVSGAPGNYIIAVNKNNNKKYTHFYTIEK